MLRAAKSGLVKTGSRASLKFNRVRLERLSLPQPQPINVKNLLFINGNNGNKNINHTQSYMYYYYIFRDVDLLKFIKFEVYRAII